MDSAADEIEGSEDVDLEVPDRLVGEADSVRGVCGAPLVAPAAEVG